MSKTLWVVQQYGSTPETGMGGRHYYFAKELAKQGYKVYVIASASHHLLRTKVLFKERYKFETMDGFTMVWVNMPLYQEAHSKQRALNWFIFPWRILGLAKVISERPDTILCAAPSPLSFIGAQYLARKFSSRLVFEVRDIWPLTLTEIGGYSVKHPFIRLMQWIEDKAYRESDAVISNLKNAVEHMQTRGLDINKFNWIPNGFSLSEVQELTPLNRESRLQLPNDKFIVGYTGTIGVANTIDTLIKSAELLKDYSNIAFVLVGGGKEKATLQQLVKEKELCNVYFIDPIPKKEIQSMLALFDACYIGWLKDDLYRFGIGANKIPEYLYSAKPIIHGYSGACDPVADTKSGITIPAENPELLAQAILQLERMSINERVEMGANGRKTALEQYEYGKLSSQLASVIWNGK